MSHFEQYAHIPIIADLIKRVDMIKEQLTNHIRQIFAELASVRIPFHLTLLLYISNVFLFLAI